MAVQDVQGRSHVVTAGEAIAGAITVQFDHVDALTAVHVAVRSSVGVAKAWDGAVAIAGKTVTVDNTGVTDFVATDVVSVFAAHG